MIIFYFLFIIFLVAIIIIYSHHESYYVKSNIDGNEYFVMKRSDKTIAADTLAQIKQNLIKLRNHLIENQNNPEYVEYQKNIRLLANNLEKINIKENITPGKYTSYLVNKGDELVMCLRSKDNQIHDLNTLMFVAIHEMAHASSSEYILGEEHTKEFSQLMAFLLKTSIALGIYRYVDYGKESIEYCGITVDATPL